MRRAIWISLAVLVTGCTAAPEGPEGVESATAETSPAMLPLGLAATGCMQGGGHSVHPISFNPLPEPWQPADVIDDVGMQLTYSEFPDPANPIPTKGSTMGNYHATMWCEGWTLDGAELEPMFFGFVGMKVEPPPFDPDPATPTHSYIVTVIATDNDEVLARLHDAGFAAMKTTATKETFPDGTLRIQMHTDGNGDYDSIYRPEEAGPSSANYVRLWFQMGAGHAHGESNTDRQDRAAGEFIPIALDLPSPGGTHYVAAAQGYFSHSGTAHHAPLPGAYGHTAAVMYDGFDREITWGPRPDVTLTEAYLH